MIFEYTFYDPSSGRILSSGVGPEMPDWAACVEGIHMPDKLIDVETKQVVERPKNPVTLNNLVLSDVPKGSTIHIDGESYECENGGEVTLQFNQVGIYAVYVESFPHLDKEFTIDYQP